MTKIFKVTHTATVQYGAHINLTETECRALEALVGYGDSAFIKAFKDSLGSAYIRDHEQGLKDFFEAVRRDVIPALEVIDRNRSILSSLDNR